jgi:CheY-like chemotaxis protein
MSGTMEAKPKQLVVVPLLHEDLVKGCLELGTLKEFTEDAMAFLERIAGNIAIALSSVQARMQLAELLQETQRQAQKLQVQQEELQASNEELEAQTNSLKEREVELQAQHEELMTLNEELEEKTDSLQGQKADIETKNTELEKARRNIEKKAEELTITNKYKSEFMANMSHELRTPLNSLLLLSHNLAQNKGGNLSEDQIESAQVMYSSGNDLLELINEILDLSKIEAGRVEMAVAKVSLQNLAERLQANFQPLIDEKGLVFSVVVDPLAPSDITSDRQRLEQVLRNLISNAIKFTEKGGITVTMRPLNEQQDALTDESLSPEAALAITVVDTGIGIPLEKQKIIFEAFQQVDGSTSRKYGGTGLGLSISRELAELLSGEIQLTSAPDRGTTFTLYIPRKLVQTEKIRQQTTPPPERRRLQKTDVEHQERPAESASLSAAIADDRDSIEENDKSILIVEDDLNFVKYLVKQSNEKGFKCLASTQGKDGLMLAEKFRPNAIILDINLPDMNGWEVLDALKKNPLLRHIPVHMISADEKTLDAFKKGAVGYLHKPVSQDDILKAFDRLDEFIDKDYRELLIVEDNKVLRQEIVKLIGNSDVHITAVATGEEVIGKLRQHKFDCMILDIGLPDMTGFELLDRLEKESEIEIPPVIIYTGRELTREEHDSLYRYTDSIIVKGVKSVERLLDETALFLHRVVDKMPADKRKMIANLYEQDAMFIDKKILIVDDDMRNAFALSKILTEKQIEVLIANTGIKALEILEAEEGVDLVLMDIMMPEMDGYETMGRIRAQEQFWNLPIIALTAKAMPEDKQKCLSAGANDYLSKPIEEARLFSVMRIWLYR